MQGSKIVFLVPPSNIGGQGNSRVVELAAGIEPATPRVQNGCSTVELRQHEDPDEYVRADLGKRILSRELLPPVELMAGVEPVAFCVRNRRSTS